MNAFTQAQWWNGSIESFCVWWCKMVIHLPFFVITNTPICYNAASWTILSYDKHPFFLFWNILSVQTEIVTFVSTGFPSTYRGGLGRKRQPWYSTSIPAFLRDPWWYEIPALRGFGGPRSAPLLRQSFLSPIKRTFVWSSHPIRRGIG